tara:strand:- start:600 stop:1106 length:507 start_codon:yes stop_codon:yes gene_type:complete
MSKNPKLKKNGGQGTAVGNWLRKIGRSDILTKAVSVIGEVASGDLLGAIQSVVAKDEKLTLDQKEDGLELIRMDFADRMDARDLQKNALNQDDLFSKRFIYYLTMAVFAFSVVVVLLLFFVTIPEENQDVVNFILGVIVGTGLTGVFNYFYGSSQGSKDKSNVLNQLQ